MSGGHFEYNQYKIDQIADEVEQLILNNGKELTDEELKDSWDDYLYHYKYPDEVIKEFKQGLEYLKKAAIYAQRIDWLVSGDDGEESFIKRLKDDLDKFKVKKK